MDHTVPPVVGPLFPWPHTDTPHKHTHTHTGSTLQFMTHNLLDIILNLKCRIFVSPSLFVSCLHPALTRSADPVSGQGLRYHNFHIAQQMKCKTYNRITFRCKYVPFIYKSNLQTLKERHRSERGGNDGAREEEFISKQRKHKLKG